MKKVLSICMFALLAIALVACDAAEPITVTVEKEVIVEVEVEKIVEVEKEVIVEVEVEKEVPVDMTPSPDVEGVVYHWMPGSIEANITATIDLLAADPTSVMVIFENEVLEDFVDYEIASSTLTIFGAYLNEKALELGEHTVKVVSAQGMTEFTIVVVDDPRDTSIATTSVIGINMSEVSNYTVVAPIVGAPELMITELSTDMGKYDYIEVFNNTTEPYNLKGHRIVFADLTKQNLLSQGIFEEPYGMSGGAFIYQEDYIIPALSSAVIWMVNAYPWAVESTADEFGIRRVYEAEGAESSLFGTSAENLSIEKFKEIYSLGEEVQVFPVRCQYMLMNGTYSNDGEGMGAPVAKSSKWGGVNSSIANRGVQIQKFNLDAEYSIAGMVDVPVGATYYKYEVGVLNQEENVYTDGVFDPTKVNAYGTGTTMREGVNIFYARILFYNDLDEFVGYTTSAESIDAYNADKAPYVKMIETAVTPISTALVYPKIDVVLTDVEGQQVETLEAVKWGAMHSLEYTIPVEGSTVMRFIPREEANRYADIYVNDVEALKTLKLDAIAPAVSEVLANKELIVPVDPAYSVTYLADGYNSIGKSGWFNFLLTEPTE